MPLCRLACAPALALTLAVSLAAPAEAGELSRFRQAVAEASQPLREALARLEEGNVAVAHLKLREALEAWRSRVLPFSRQPPDPLDRDPAFDEVLQEVAVRLQKAEALSANGEQAFTREQAAPILPALAALRARNGLWSFSDCIQRAHEAVAALWELRETTPAADDWPEMDGLAYLSAVAHDRYRQCRRNGPEEAVESEEFARLHDAITAGLLRLRDALAVGDGQRIGELLVELRDLDRLFWLRFG